MTVIINGTTGITSVNGSAAAPSVTGTDTDTGIVYGTNTVTIATGGTAGLVQNSVQGVQIANTLGVGATTPSTSGAGITFPATQSASTNANTLDDYEEGTFTARVGTATVNYTMTEYYGFYTKIGNVVTVETTVSWSDKNGAASSDTFLLKNLPFPVKNDPNMRAGGIINGLTTTYTTSAYVTIYGGPTDTNLQFLISQSDSSMANILSSQVSAASATRCFITYLTD